MPSDLEDFYPWKPPDLPLTPPNQGPPTSPMAPGDHPRYTVSMTLTQLGSRGLDSSNCHDLKQGHARWDFCSSYKSLQVPSKANSLGGQCPEDNGINLHLRTWEEGAEESSSHVSGALGPQGICQVCAKKTAASLAVPHQLFPTLMKSKG